MHRTFAGDLDELGGQTRIDIAINADHALEPVDLAGAPFDGLAAVLAVVDRNLAVADVDRQAPERKLLVVG
jgi:hypothetical protein